MWISSANPKNICENTQKHHFAGCADTCGHRASMSMSRLLSTSLLTTTARNLLSCFCSFRFLTEPFLFLSDEGVLLQVFQNVCDHSFQFRVALRLLSVNLIEIILRQVLCMRVDSSTVDGRALPEDLFRVWTLVSRLLSTSLSMTTVSNFLVSRRMCYSLVRLGLHCLSPSFFLFEV